MGPIIVHETEKYFNYGHLDVLVSRMLLFDSKLDNHWIDLDRHCHCKKNIAMLSYILAIA